MSDRIKKIKEGYFINIYLDGKINKSFNEISDNYAHTNAKNWVSYLQKKINRGEI